MNWVQRKIYLYNVTFGLYMLDWWERFLFNALVLILMWFIFYNGSRNLTQFYKSGLVTEQSDDSSATQDESFDAYFAAYTLHPSEVEKRPLQFPLVYQ